MNNASWYTETRSEADRLDLDQTMGTSGAMDQPAIGQTSDQGGGQVAQQAQQVTQQAQQQVGKVTQQVRDQLTSQLNQQKSRATSTLDSLSLAMRETSQRMQEQGQAPLATAAEKAADQVERVSSYLSQHEVAELRAEAENFARTRTPLFLAGAFAIGWLGARFFKSSAPPNGTSTAGYSSNRALPVTTSQTPYSF